MESTEAPGVSFCLPHPELGDFFLTGSALLACLFFSYSFNCRFSLRLARASLLTKTARTGPLRIVEG